jgi:predicted PurR-regulated permease PerM
LLVAKIHDLLPRRIEPTVAALARESDEVIGAFLRGQLIVMSALGVHLFDGVGDHRLGILVADRSVGWAG